jgi:hypothetical protein
MAMRADAKTVGLNGFGRIMLATWGVLVISAAAMAQTPKPQLQVSTRPVGTLPRGMAPQDVYVSPDGTRFAFAAPSRDKVVAVVDGVQQRKYDWIVDGRIGFTADSERFFYVIRKRGKRVMVIERAEGKEYDSIDEPVVSPTGGRVGYVGGRDNVFYPVVDNVEGKPYENVVFAALSEKGKWACIVRIGRQQCVVIDGVEGNRYDRVADVQMSDDGGRVAYRAQRGDQWFMVVDGKEGKPYAEVGSVEVSADGAHYAYAARTGESYFLVQDGAEKRLTNTAMPGYVTLSRDGKRLAYATVAPGGNGVTVVVDDKPQERYDQVLAVRFSRDGRRVAFVARRGGKSIIVADGVEVSSAELINPASLSFSRDGDHLAWVANAADKDVLFVDGMVGPSFDYILGAGPVAFDEQRIPFIAADEREGETPLGTPDRIVDLVDVTVSIGGR